MPYGWENFAGNVMNAYQGSYDRAFRAKERDEEQAARAAERANKIKQQEFENKQAMDKLGMEKKVTEARIKYYQTPKDYSYKTPEELGRMRRALMAAGGEPDEELDQAYYKAVGVPRTPKGAGVDAQPQPASDGILGWAKNFTGKAAKFLSGDSGLQPKQEKAPSTDKKSLYLEYRKAGMTKEEAEAKVRGG